jgi:hypothetical protein
MTRPLVRIRSHLMMPTVRARPSASSHSCAADSTVNRLLAPRATRGAVTYAPRLALDPRFRTARRPQRQSFESPPPFQSP